MTGPPRRIRREGRPDLVDTVANLAGLGASGVAGLLLLAIIAAAYGPAELGRFNLVLAVYLLVSQVATLAIHHGVLHHLGVHRDDSDPERRSVLLGALVAATLIATAVVLILLVVAEPLLALVGRGDLWVGMRWGVPAAGFFAINKVLLSALNALARFRAFAAGNALRGGLILITGGALALRGAPGASLPALLLIAEGTLLALLLILLRTELASGPAGSASVVGWARRLLTFGVRGVAGGFLADLNTRVDVLCLSLFVDDRTIGIYSLVAVLAEALHQVPVVIRSLLSPRVVTLLVARDGVAIRALVRSTQTRILPAMLLLGTICVAAFPHVIPRIIGEEFAAGSLPLIILIAGVVLASTYTPFGLALVQGGDPSGNSLLLVASVGLNIAGNLLLIPILGVAGAALATALTMVATVVLLRGLSRHRLGITI